MRHLAAVVLLFAAACEDGKSPVQPTPSTPVSPQPAPPLVFSLSGSVQDTASRPLAGVRVEVIAGDRSGTFETTDSNGRFRMPGTFTGTVTLAGSKDGYHQESQTLPYPQTLRRLPSLENLNLWTNLSLQPDGPPANITGEYTLTITADRSCSTLPDEVRARTYSVTIVPGERPTAFRGRVSDGRFIPESPCVGRPPDSCIHNYVEIGMAGDFASFWTRILEQLSETIYVVIDGGVSAPFAPSGISAPLNAQFIYCPVRPLFNGDYWTCPADADAGGVECNSAKHQVTLVQR